MATDITLEDVTKFLDAEATRSGGATRWVEGLISGSLQPGEKLAIVRINGGRAEPLTEFHLSKRIGMGSVMIGFFILPQGANAEAPSLLIVPPS